MPTNQNVCPLATFTLAQINQKGRFEKKVISLNKSLNPLKAYYPNKKVKTLKSQTNKFLVQIIHYCGETYMKRKVMKAKT